MASYSPGNSALNFAVPSIVAECAALTESRFNLRKRAANINIDLKVRDSSEMPLPLPPKYNQPNGNIVKWQFKRGSLPRMSPMLNPLTTLL